MPQTTGLPTHSCLSPSPFLGKPTIIQPPSVLVAYVGQPGVFHCVAVGDPKPSIQWRNDSDVVTTGGRLEVFVNGTLKIKSLLKSDDSSFFTCEAENLYGSTSAIASLKVKGIVYHLAVIVTGKSSIFHGNSIKDGAYYCYCAYDLRISRYSDFLSPMLTNTGIFLRGLKLSGESRS